MKNTLSGDLSHIFDGYHFIDVRAPIEFVKGAIPNSVNLPIMNDEERQRVGKCYKQEGNETATRLGYKLTSAHKESRVKAWVDFASLNPGKTMIFCWRGGQRSHIAQEWIKEAGVDIPLIEGGFKRIRNHLLNYLDTNALDREYLVISGKTGTGKTLLLNEFSHKIDLEGLAHHKGSSFGRQVEPQPTQINFEHAIAIQLMKLQSSLPIIVEDESTNIGSVSIPQKLFSSIHNSPVLVLEETVEDRVKVIIDDYIIGLSKNYIAAHPNDGYELYSEHLCSALFRVRKRLGGELYSKLDNHLKSSLQVQKTTGQVTQHDSWIVPMLVEYYDGMYKYQFDKQKRKVLIKGDSATLKEFILQHKKN